MPRFLGIGAMRAGTSWLARRLAEHPSIHLPRKEIHFFDRKIERRKVPLLPVDAEARLRYGIRFARGSLRGRIAGEFTPAYAVLAPDRIATVHAWMPGLKLIYIMRDPVERAWSQAKHDYASFLRRDAARAPREELIAFFERPAVRARGDYATCLDNWLRFFGREQLFVTTLEDVARDPALALDGVFRFLGTDPAAAPRSDLATPVHRSAATPMPGWVRAYLEETLRPDDRRVEEVLGRRPPWVETGS
jgi:hypothetical protein